MTESIKTATVYNYKPEGSTISFENNFFVFENENQEKVIFSRGSDMNIYVHLNPEKQNKPINITAQFGRRHYAQAFDIMQDAQGDIKIAIAISSKSMQSSGKVYISEKIKKEDLYTFDWNSVRSLFTEYPPNFSLNAEIKNMVFGKNQTDYFLIVDAKRVGDLAGVDHYVIINEKKEWNKVALPNDVKNPIQVIFGMHGQPAIWSLYNVGHDQVLQWTAPSLFSGYPNDVSQPYKNLPSNIHYIKNIYKPDNQFDDLMVAGDGLFLYTGKSNTSPLKLENIDKNIRKLDCLVSSKTEQNIVILNTDKSFQLYIQNSTDSIAPKPITYAESVENFCIVQNGKQTKIALLISKDTFKVDFYELKDNNLIKCDNSIQLNPIWNVPPLTSEELNEVISKNGPKLYFHSKEQFFMSKVGYYLENVGCWDDNKKEWLHRPGSLWDSAKNDMKPLSFPEDTEENMKNIWLKIPYDSKDVLLDPNILKAGKSESECEAYIHAKFSEQEDCTDIQFWLFYPFNGAGAAYIWLPTESSERVDLNPLGTHEGDWEHVTIRIDNYSMQLVGAWMSQHGHQPWIDASEIQKEDGKPLFYSSRHGHANYSSAGSNMSPDFEIEHVCHFGLRNDTDKSRRYLECSSRYKIISAAFLETPPTEPNWLQFKFRWGARFFFGRESVEDVIKDNLPITLRVIVGLLPGGFLINNLLLQYLFPNIAYDKLLPDGEKYSAGPAGPKKKGLWLGDENSGG